jgi:hypothetical protein
MNTRWTCTEIADLYQPLLADLQATTDHITLTFEPTETPETTDATTEAG